MAKDSNKHVQQKQRKKNSEKTNCPVVIYFNNFESLSPNVYNMGIL